VFLVCVIYPSLYSLYRIYTENIKKFGVLRPRTPPLSLPHLPRDDVSPPTIHRQAACGLAALVVFLSPRVPRLGDGLRGCGGSAWRAGGFQCVLEPPGKQFEDGSGLGQRCNVLVVPLGRVHDGLGYSCSAPLRALHRGVRSKGGSS